jgi:hypothetical protein
MDNGLKLDHAILSEEETIVEPQIFKNNNDYLNKVLTKTSASSRGNTSRASVIHHNLA